MTAESEIQQGSIDNSVQVEGIYINTSQNIIQITEDKAKLILMKVIQGLKKKNEYSIPLSIFIPSLVSLLTANFHDFYLPKDVWIAVFYITTATSFIWLVVSVIKAIRNRKCNIDFIIKQMKKEEAA